MFLRISPDQLATAGAYVSREWGDYGNRIEAIESPTWAVSLFHVVTGDGGRFVVAVDRWSNTGGPVESHGYDTPERTAALAALVRQMHERATAA